MASRTLSTSPCGESETAVVSRYSQREWVRNFSGFKDFNISAFGNIFKVVVGSPGDFGSFCQPNRTESENLDYVLRDKKACVRCAELLERARANE